MYIHSNVFYRILNDAKVLVYLLRFLCDQDPDVTVHYCFKSVSVMLKNGVDVYSVGLLKRSKVG